MLAKINDNNLVSVDLVLEAIYGLINKEKNYTESDLNSDRLRNTAKIIYTSRRMRAKFISKSMFGEPAWDILLVLYFDDPDCTGLTTKLACMAADVPQTTAWRWLQVLKEQKLIEQVGSDDDGRLSRVRLTASGKSAMEDCLANCSALS